ncbi:MAG: uroporphyrinogen decarboxylase family protein [Sphaerochaetaceae bacterium]
MSKGRERALAAINHKSGKVPIDFGSLMVTGMHISTVEKLREHYGLPKVPVKVFDPYQMLGEIDSDLREAMQLDTLGFAPYANIFGVANKDWKEWTTPWNQDVLIPGNLIIEKLGDDMVLYPKGDKSAPPSAKMPDGGYFFDSIIRQEEFDDDELTADDNLEEFVPVSDEILNYYKKVVSNPDFDKYLTLTDFGGSALGDIALVPGPGLPHPKGIRDITEWYISTVLRQDLLHEIFERQTELAIENLKKIHSVVKDKIDVVMTCGTDFGTQNSSFCSTDTFDELYLPYYKKLNDWIHANTSWKTFKHSCGAVFDFMSHFIDAGFDIINPVQLSAANMDAKKLKNEFGKDLVFWGGGVDTQQTLPFGKPEEVRAEVLSRCEILSKDGGFVFNAIHNVQALTPIENIVAMVNAVHEFNGEL